MAHPNRSRYCLPGVLLAAAVLLGGALGASSASAQGFNFLNNLFGGGSSRQPAPAYPGYGGGGYGSGYGNGGADNNYYAPRRHPPRKKRPVVADQPADKAKTPTKNATVFVDVYGDSMGQLLANGLDEALADRSEVGVVHKAKGSTGLVTTSFYDWPKAIRDQLDIKDSRETKESKDKESKDKDTKTKDVKASDGEKRKETKDAKGSDAKTKDGAKEESSGHDGKAAEAKDKVDVAVMMIGTNDRQTITEDGKKYEPGSDEWAAIYKKRILAINEAFAKKKIPLIWVGIPITKDDNFADDMAALNEIYREMAAKTGATYVDTWEAFSDDDGKFAAFGPDVNGQVVRLRSEDGIHFTKAGARKLAHFVEAHVRRDLDGKAPLPQLPTADTSKPDDKKEKGASKPAVVLVKPEAGPIRNLSEAPTARDGKLSEVPKQTTDVANASSGKEKSESNPSAPAGRADNFHWPADGKTPPQ